MPLVGASAPFFLSVRWGCHVVGFDDVRLWSCYGLSYLCRVFLGIGILTGSQLAVAVEGESCLCWTSGWNGRDPYTVCLPGAQEVLQEAGWTINMIGAIISYPSTKGLDGSCKPQREAPDKCPAFGSSAGSAGRYNFGTGGPSAMCSPDGCGVVFEGDFPTHKDAAGNVYGTGSLSYTGGNKGSCTPTGMPSKSPGATPADDGQKSTDGPCAPGEGVMTSSSGRVACVPPGTPGAKEPKVGTKTSEEKFGDGSRRVTETTTTCSGDDACQTTTRTTTYGPGGSSAPGSGPGQAGEPGVKEDKTDSSSKNGGTPDKEADGCDPAKEWCGSPSMTDLYTKKDQTFSGPLTRFSAGVRQSVIGTGAASFFQVTIPGGSCPNMVTSFSVFGSSMTVDLRSVFCSQDAVSMLRIAGAVLMVVAALVSFRWALL